MGTSNQSFNQVKSILGKLDRSIDEARAKRLHGDRPPMREAGEMSEPVIGRSEEPKAAENESKYGRAKPLRPSDGSGWFGG